MNVFNYSRKKIHEEYCSRYDYSFTDVKNNEQYDLDYIDFCEAQSKCGIKEAITYRFKAFAKALNDEEKLFVISGIIITVFVIVVFFLGIRKMPLNILILNASESFFTCFIILLVIFAYRLIRKRLIRRKVFYIMWFVFFLASIPHIPVLFGYETTQIGDFYEANEYTEKYYVIMSREPKTITSRKQYTLPAEIERRYDYLYSDEYDDCFDLNYHINQLYFSNGGYLSFDYDYAYEEISCSEVLPNTETKVRDYHNDEYYVTLTTEKVN